MEINEIKKRLPILTVLFKYSIKPDKNNHIRCPFHADDKPSMKIYPETGTYHCFGCGKTGDQIQWIQDKEGCSRHEAILKAKELINPVESKKLFHRVNEMPTESIKAGTPKESIMKEDFKTLFADQQKALSTETPSSQRSFKALEYIKQRGLEQIQEIGFNSGNKWKKLKQCITFPLKDAKGNVVSLYGRRIMDSLPKTKNSYSMEFGKHYYSEKRSGLYPGYPDPETETLILTEAIIDAATLLQIPEITEHLKILSCYGNLAFVKEAQEAVKNLPKLKEIIIFFDGDQGGLDGIKHVSEIMQKIKPDVKLTAVATPEKEDVNSLFVKYGEDCLIQLIKERKPCETILSQGKPVNETSFSSEIPLIEKEVQTHGRASHLLDTTNPNKIIYETQTARYIVKGGLPRQLDKMLISLDVQHLETALKYRCRLDLYEEKQTRKEAREAAEKLDLRSDLIENDLSTLCDLLEEHREQELEASHREKSQVPPFNDVPAPRFRECQTFLMQPDVFNELDKLMEEYGIIGEENNRKLGFCIVSSFNMPEPLHGIIIGTSGSGKTYLMVCECDLMPPERYMPITRATDNSFYHFEKFDLTHRLISVEDKDSMSFESNLSLREMQSRGVLRLSTSGKNTEGNIHTFQKVVFGPIASLSCTTRGDGYDDDMNRCFIMSIDESPGQTAKIIEYQNRLSAGMHNKKRKNEIREFIRDLVRILKPYEVVNPYATSIHLPPEVKDPRRLNNLLRALIQQITLLHQYQRKKDAQGRLITTKEDVRLAINIMFDAIVLKADDLNGQLRKFFEQLKNHVKSQGGDNYRDYTFRQKEIRMALMYSKTKVYEGIRELCEMEYIQKVWGNGNDPSGSLFKITCWDSVESLRERIKTYLNKQLDELQ